MDRREGRREVRGRMHVWVDGLMDEWVDRQMHGWING